MHVSFFQVYLSHVLSNWLSNEPDLILMGVGIQTITVPFINEK
jgi:hypothetical protein